METLANRPQNSPNLPPQPAPERTPRVPKPGLPLPEFKVGDFVWAKIKTHLWWPARVVVPKAGSYLVSLFLAGSGSHCRESYRLKRFGEEFEPMSKQTSTKSFAVAVRVAAYELAKESLSDFAPEEFLRIVKEAACDVSACDLLVAARLESWVLSFVRENGLVVGSLSELVDVEPIPKGPEIRDGLPSLRRKRKSMAEIISVTPDVVSSGKPREKGVDLPSVEVGGGVAEEGIGSPRRERKKSKYLSPPYTFGSGYKRSDSFKEGEEEEEEEEVVNEAAGQKEEEKVSALRKYAGISSYVILSQLLLAAADPLFRISNRPAKAIWSFLTEFRSSACSRDAEFEDYVKGLVWSGGSEMKIVRSEVIGEAKFAADKDAFKVGGNAEASLSVGSEPRKRGRRKKDSSLGEVSMNLGLRIESRKKEDAANCVSMVGKYRLPNGGAPRDVCHDTTGLTELAKSGQKRKSGEEGANSGIQSPNSTGGYSKESEEERAPRQTRKKKEVNVVAPLVEEPKHPFAYVRENLEMMISTLTGTSSGIVLAGGLKQELKENLVNEIQGMINRVNILQSEIARYS